MEPNAKKPRRRETITLPDDLAAKLGCREVFEDELEARLKVAEEIGFEEDGRLLEAVLSLRNNEEFINALSLGDLSMLSRVNRVCCEGVSDWVGESRTRLSVRHHVVSKERLKWARENGCPWGEGVCSAAARGGHLEVLQYARANGCLWDETTCSAAALGGHLDVLQWARANGCPWNESTCRAAAGKGHLEVLQWARANGCPWDETTYEAAVAKHHLDVVQWAKENDCPGAVQVRLGLDETGNLSSLAGWEQTFDVHEIIHDWADTNSTDHMSYDQAVALVNSKGHTLETLNKCLEEFGLLRRGRIQL